MSSMSAAATRSRWQPLVPRPRRRGRLPRQASGGPSAQATLPPAAPVAGPAAASESARRVEPGSELHAAEQRGVGAVEVDGGASALSAELEQRGEIGDDDGRVPVQRRAARPQPHGDRLGERPSLRQAPGRGRALRRRDVVDDPLQAPPHPSQGRDRREPASQQPGEPRPWRAGDAAQRGGLAHGPSGGGRRAVGSAMMRPMGALRPTTRPR